jgi:hypothetical protein
MLGAGRPLPSLEPAQQQTYTRCVNDYLSIRDG